MKISESSERSLDLSQLMALVGPDTDGPSSPLADFVQMFIQEATTRLDDAHRALASGDLVVMRLAAHSLRGACGMLRAPRMQALATRLEEAVDGQGCNLAAMIRELDDEFARLRPLLHPYMADDQRTR
jgi:HPt (histidine-containing phosphotransfer) domain-containing protein